MSVNFCKQVGRCITLPVKTDSFLVFLLISSVAGAIGLFCHSHLLSKQEEGGDYHEESNGGVFFHLDLRDNLSSWPLFIYSNLSVIRPEKSSHFLLLLAT